MQEIILMIEILVALYVVIYAFANLILSDVLKKYATVEHLHREINDLETELKQVSGMNDELLQSKIDKCVTVDPEIKEFVEIFLENSGRIGKSLNEFKDEIDRELEIVKHRKTIKRTAKKPVKKVAKRKVVTKK